MKAKKKTHSFSIDCRHGLLFSLICKYYDINPSKKVDEMIKSFNELYSHDFLNTSYIGKRIALLCHKPWAIGWAEVEEEGLSTPPDEVSLANIDLDKLFLLKDDIIELQKKGNKIEKFRPSTMYNMTNLFEGSVRWEDGNDTRR